MSDDRVNPTSWPELRRVEDGELAHDLVAAILSMEFEASLVDLSDGSIVTGVGCEVDPEAQAPIVLHVKSGYSGRHGTPAHMRTEPASESRARRTAGGPWSLRVPEDQLAELHEVLDELIEERNQFEMRVERNRSSNTNILRGVLIVGVAVFVIMYVLWQLFS